MFRFLCLCVVHAMDTTPICKTIQNNGMIASTSRLVQHYTCYLYTFGFGCSSLRPMLAFILVSVTIAYSWFLIISHISFLPISFARLMMPDDVICFARSGVSLWACFCTSITITHEHEHAHTNSFRSLLLSTTTTPTSCQ